MCCNPINHTHPQLSMSCYGSGDLDLGFRVHRVQTLMIHILITWKLVLYDKIVWNSLMEFQNHTFVGRNQMDMMNKEYVL